MFYSVMSVVGRCSLESVTPPQSDGMLHGLHFIVTYTNITSVRKSGGLHIQQVR